MVSRRRGCCAEGLIHRPCESVHFLCSRVTTDVMKVLDKTETLQTLCLLAVQRMSQRFRRRWVSVSGRLQVMLFLTFKQLFPSGSRPASCNAHVSLRSTYKDFLSTVILWARTLCLQWSCFYLSVYNLVDNNLTRAGMNVPFIRGERLYLFKEQKAWTKNIHWIPKAWSYTENTFTHFCTVLGIFDCLYLITLHYTW